MTQLSDDVFLKMNPNPMCAYAYQRQDRVNDPNNLSIILSSDRSRIAASYLTIRSPAIKGN